MSTINTLYDDMIKNAFNGSEEEKVSAKPKEKEDPPVPEVVLKEEEHEDYYKIPFTSIVGSLRCEMTVIKDKRPDFLVTVYKDSYWSEDAKAFIPELFAEYLVPTNYLYEILLAWELGDNVLGFGAPGTGKTTLVKMAAAITNRPYVRINGKKDMESANIFGSMDFDGEKTNWHNGPAPFAALEGAVFNVDEGFVIPPDISMGFNPMLEDTPRIILDDKIGTAVDRIITPRESFRIVFTDNTGGAGDMSGEYAGVDVQNTSTLDRFQTTIKMDYLPKDEEAKMLRAKYPALKADTAKHMVQTASLIREAYSKGELTITMSPRTLFSWGQKIIHWKDARRALQMCFLNRVQNEADSNAIRNILQTTFGSKTV